MSLFLIREAAQNDLPYLLDIDVKCFELPYSIENWRFLATDAHIKVAVYNHTVVGFAVFSFENREHDPEGILDTLRLGKLAVKKDYQKLGIGRKLVSSIYNAARELHCSYIRGKVLETLVYNDDKRLRRFLQAAGFKAVGLQREAVQMYGEKLDRIEFEAIVKEKETVQLPHK